MSVSAAALVAHSSEICRVLGLHGNLLIFGSRGNGLRTKYSDLDITYLRGKTEKLSIEDILNRIAELLPKCGFHSVSKVFQCSMPLLKAVDWAGQEVDICVDNELGLRNSCLLNTYCSLDPRVSYVCKRVKQWAARFELDVAEDGHLNSYAWTLLAIYHLMNVEPPVIPNLQDLFVEEVSSKATSDSKFWNGQDIPPSSNKSTVEDLLYSFFGFYFEEFDFQHFAVSIRLALTPRDRGVRSINLSYRAKASSKARCGVPKAEVAKRFSNQWFIEDPFICENLARTMSANGRNRIFSAMETLVRSMGGNKRNYNSVVHKMCPESWTPTSFFSKFSVDESVKLESFVDLFEDNRIVYLYYPRCSAKTAYVCDAYLEFKTAADRKEAHAKNETTMDGWQIHMFICSSHALAEALDIEGITYDMLDLETNEIIEFTKKVWRNNESSRQAVPAYSLQTYIPEMKEASQLPQNNALAAHRSLLPPFKAPPHPPPPMVDVLDLSKSTGKPSTWKAPPMDEEHETLNSERERGAPKSKQSLDAASDGTAKQMQDQNGWNALGMETDKTERESGVHWVPCNNNNNNNKYNNRDTCGRKDERREGGTLRVRDQQQPHGLANDDQTVNGLVEQQKREKREDPCLTGFSETWQRMKAENWNHRILELKKDLDRVQKKGENEEDGSLLGQPKREHGEDEGPRMRPALEGNGVENERWLVQRKARQEDPRVWGAQEGKYGKNEFWLGQQKEARGEDSRLCGVQKGGHGGEARRSHQNGEHVVDPRLAQRKGNINGGYMENSAFGSQGKGSYAENLRVWIDGKGEPCEAQYQGQRKGEQGHRKDDSDLFGRGQGEGPQYMTSLGRRVNHGLGESRQLDERHVYMLDRDKQPAQRNGYTQQRSALHREEVYLNQEQNKGEAASDCTVSTLSYLHRHHEFSKERAYDGFFRPREVDGSSKVS